MTIKLAADTLLARLQHICRIHQLVDAIGEEDRQQTDAACPFTGFQISTCGRLLPGRQGPAQQPNSRRSKEGARSPNTALWRGISCPIPGLKQLDSL